MSYGVRSTKLNKMLRIENRGGVIFSMQFVYVFQVSSFKYFSQLSLLTSIDYWVPLCVNVGR